MKIKFIKHGTQYRLDEVVDMPPNLAPLYVKRGVAEYVKEAKPKRNKAVKRSKVKTKAVTSG